MVLDGEGRPVAWGHGGTASETVADGEGRAVWLAHKGVSVGDGDV